MQNQPDRTMQHRPAPPTRDDWFPARKYGWGWGPPVAWQGWVVLLAFVAVECALPFLIGFAAHPFRYMVWSAGLALVLVFICWMKGERPRWRWGED